MEYFHDSLNIVVILAPGRELISFNIKKIKLNDEHFSFETGTVTIHVWDKPYQEINFESPSNTDLHMFRLFYFSLIISSSILQGTKRCQFKSHRNILVFWF